MILKKPYRFLIKNFRTIHIILSLLTIFIAYQSNAILKFVNDFIANNYSVTVTSNMASHYISPLLYFAIILVIIALIAVYVLLSVKKKPNKLYLFTIIYYIILLITVFIAAFLINSLEESLWVAGSARSYRDLMNIIYYPQFFFILILVIRALGFNVKQFSFTDDLKEMQITDADSEEIEVNINFETYKAKRTIHRFFRELKYYFLENKRIFFLLGIILVLILSFIFFKNYEKTQYNYKENESFMYNGLSIKITDSMITNIDLNGNNIYDNSYFVLVKLNISNNTVVDKELDYNNFKLYYDGDYVYPKLDMGNYFIDYGDPYMGDIISAKESKTYIIPYLIDSKYKNNSFKINIYLGSSKNTNQFTAKNATVKLNPNLIENVETVRTAKLNELVSFSSTNLGDSSFLVNSVDFTNRYQYTYQDCYKNECRNYSDVIVADVSYQNRQALIALGYDLSLDNKVASYENINDIQAFADSFFKVEYIINGESTITKPKNVTPTKIKDKIVLQTDGDILQADKINLLITIRDRSYAIELK